MPSLASARVDIAQFDLPSALRCDLERCLADALFAEAETLERLPSMGGAYALIIHLAEQISPDLPRLAPEPMGPGWYLYAGSAYGPGGLRARLSRHFRTKKTAHWHVDRLTNGRCPAGALAFPDQCECDIAARLAGSACFGFALAGFGASDCRRCTSHLLHWCGQNQ